MKILLVDDHILFREGLASLLNMQADFEVAGAANSVSEAIEQAQALQPDLILMGYDLRDGKGPEATQIISANQPQILIIFLTVYEDDKHLFAAIRSGAKGYLPKNIPVEQLMSYLRHAGDGEPAITPGLTKRILERFSETEPRSPVRDSVVSSLTPRELQVLQEVARGHSNQMIATNLFISERTVKNHVSRIFSKLKLNNRYEAAELALRIGLKDIEI